MWKVLPKFALLKIIAWLFSALLLAGLMMWLGEDFKFIVEKDNFLQAAGFSSIAAIALYGFVWVLAKWGWLVLWHFPGLKGVLNKNVCPNLNGQWQGKIYSRHRDENGNKIVKVVNMNIKADFLGFTISFDSADKYQESSVVQSEIYKDERNGKFSISYIFESIVPNPEPTDDSKFDGAAKLMISFEGDEIMLKGTYWTNRAWQRDLQTAGRIELRRLK